MPCSPDAQKHEAPGPLSCTVMGLSLQTHGLWSESLISSGQKAIPLLTSSGMEELPYEEWDLIVNQKLHQVLSHTAFYSSQQREKNSSPGQRSGLLRISLLLHLLLHPFLGPFPKQTNVWFCFCLPALLVHMVA